MTPERIDELREIAQDSPRTMIEVFRKEFLELLDLAEGALSHEPEEDL